MFGYLDFPFLGRVLSFARTFAPEHYVHCLIMLCGCIIVNEPVFSVLAITIGFVKMNNTCDPSLMPAFRPVFMAVRLKRRADAVTEGFDLTDDKAVSAFLSATADELLEEEVSRELLTY